MNLAGNELTVFKYSYLSTIVQKTRKNLWSILDKNVELIKRKTHFITVIL